MTLTPDAPPLTSPLPPSVTADPRRAEGLDRVRRQVLAGSTSRRVETRADEAAAMSLLLAAAADGDEAARTTLATLGQLPCTWRELRARVTASPPRKGSPVDTPALAGSRPLAVTRPRSRVSGSQLPAGVTA
ncbi:hypothetical protein [Streptomyces olivochromogenes]|uniref:Uncharacterized protein n=1 Tax=Streptomyces olivochromogenes TaxID=1963 RepID=A0A250VFG6_STROL|nr:hypothetical protein [Streptomyces olivochromogenes]KUN47433.1 hypothetical protein AQJ27_10885 [Streptomyces olivochromogenes]GAX52849.1 hypothetical protein SO3561_04368 [Streptomyces olivochromogenes]